MFEELIENLNLTSSNRISIKCYFDGRIDKNRHTYCFGILSDLDVDKLMSSLTDNYKAKKYILRRNNSKSSFIVSIDSDSVRFYLDFGFLKNKISMVSVEIKNNLTENNSSENNFKIRNYIPTNPVKLPDFFRPLQPYLSNCYISRDDGQNYFRFSTTPPVDLFCRFCPSEREFFYNVGSAAWFQFSQNSFTFYFVKKETINSKLINNPNLINNSKLINNSDLITTL